MSSSSRVADSSSVNTNQSQTPTTRRPGIAPPPVPTVSSTTATQNVANGTFVRVEDDDGSSRSREGVAPHPRPPPPPRRTSLKPEMDSADTPSTVVEQWNDVNQDHVIYNVMTFVVKGRRELNGSMLSIDYRDAVEHGSEVRDYQSGTVYRRKTSGVYFRLTSAGEVGNQLKIGDEVLAVAGYQLADMSLETARVLLDDQDDEKGITVTVARLKEFSNNGIKMSASQDSTEHKVEGQTSDVINYTEIPLVPPPRRKKSVKQKNDNETFTEETDYNQLSQDGSTVDEQNDHGTMLPMTTVIRLDSNGNIEMDKAHVEDNERLIIREDYRRGGTPHSLPDEHFQHTGSNAGEHIFRATINCDDESVTPDLDDNSIADYIDTDTQTGRGRPSNVLLTSTAEFNDSNVQLPPSVFPADLPPPPLPLSMPPMSATELSSTAQRPQTILLQSDFEKDSLPSPLTVVLPPPSPYAVSPVDEVASMPVSELESPESPVASVPPFQRLHVDLNADELDLVKRAFTEENFSSKTTPAVVGDNPVVTSTSETIDITLTTSSSPSSSPLETAENKPTNDPRLTSYLSLVGGRGFNNRRQVASAVRSLVHKSSSSSPISNTGTSGSNNSGESHHGNREYGIDSPDASREAIDRGRSLNYTFVHDIRSDATSTELDEHAGSVETTHVVTTHVETIHHHVSDQVDSCNAAQGIDNQQVRTSSNDTLSSMRSEAVLPSTSSVSLNGDVTIIMTSQDKVVTGSATDSKTAYGGDTKRRVGGYVTSPADVKPSGTEDDNDYLASKSGVEDKPSGNSNEITATTAPDENVSVVTSSLATPLSPPPSDVIVEGTDVESVENEVFDTVPTGPPVDELSPVTPNIYEALSKSRLSLRSDQAVSDILRDYYSASENVVEDVSSKKTAPVKPIISQALLPRPLRGSSQTSQISTTSGVDYTVPLCLLKGTQEQGTIISTSGKADAADQKSATKKPHTATNEKTNISEVSSARPNQNSGSAMSPKYEIATEPEVLQSSLGSSSQVIKPTDDPHNEASTPDTTRLEIASSRAYFESLKDTVNSSKIRSLDTHRVEGQLLYQKHQTSSQTSSDSANSSAVEHGDVQHTTDNKQSVELGCQISVEVVSKSVKNDLRSSEDYKLNAEREKNDEVPKMADSKAFFESIQKNKAAVVPNRSKPVGRSTSLLSKSKVESPPIRNPVSVSELPVTANKSEEDTISELPSMADSKAFFENLRKQQRELTTPPPILTKPKVVSTVRSTPLPSPSTGQATPTQQSKPEAEALNHEVPRSTLQEDRRNSKDLGLTGGLVAKIDTPTRTSWTSLQWKPAISKTTTETSSSNSVTETDSLDTTASVTGAKEFFKSKATPPQPVKRGSSMSAVDLAPRPTVRTSSRPLQPTPPSTQLAPTLEVTVSSSNMSSSDTRSSTAAAEGRSSVADKKSTVQHRTSLTSQFGGDTKTKLWKQFMTDYGKQ